MLGSNPEFLIWSVSDLDSRISKRFPDGLNYSQIYKASFVSVIVKLWKVKKILFGGLSNYNMGFPGGASGKEFNCQGRRHRRWRFHPWVRISISPGRGNGNPLQYSCLENSKDRGAWWVTVHAAAKRWTWLSNWGHKLHMLGATLFLLTAPAPGHPDDHPPPPPTGEFPMPLSGKIYPWLPFAMVEFFWSVDWAELYMKTFLTPPRPVFFFFFKPQW